MAIRGLVLLSVAALTVAAVAITVWQSYAVLRDLTRAEASVSAIRTAIGEGDVAARDRAISDLQAAATRAESRTDGAWWGMLTHAPLVGDDAEGLRILTRTLSLVSTDGVAPVAASVDKMDQLVADDRLDLELLISLRAPVARASQVFSVAADDVNGVDASGFFGIFGQRYSAYANELDQTATSLRSADVALQVVPDMVGANEERDYLLLFQNNAEIRATGGMPGSWAHVHAESGRLDMVRQGTASDFPVADKPVVPLTDAELAVYGAEYALYFQDPGFAPDFQRGAEMWNAHWESQFPGVKLDGVIALDPVGMSYLLQGTGPVVVDGRSLTSANVVDELLSRPYLELDAQQQDAFFEKSAAAIFTAATEELRSPLAFVEGFIRAAREGRFLVAPFDPQENAWLRGSRVLGDLSSDDGRVPHIDIGVNDATGSKMSYYLRYRASIDSQSCEGGRQQLSGRMTLSQTISPGAAAVLPESVTGSGDFGTEQGLQTVLVRLYSPFDGSVSDLMIDGRSVEPAEQNIRIDRRQVITVVAEISTRDDVVVTWTMESGEGQTGDVELGMTPSIVPGNGNRTVASSC